MDFFRDNQSAEKVTSKKVIRVCLNSGGRESVAMSKIMKDEFGNDFFDIELHAKTGDDPVGFEQCEYLKRYHGWSIEYAESKYGNLREYYENKEVDTGDGFIGHALPSQANKDCSEKFKIIPETKYLVDKFGLDVVYELYFGFSDNKKDKARARRMEKILSKKVKIKQIPKFPLIEKQIDRKKAGDICVEFMGFLPEPTKCLSCFERTIQDWKDDFKKMPNAMNQVIKYEESSKLFKKFGYGLSMKPIRKILRIPDQEQQTLDIKPCPCVEDFDMEKCLTDESLIKG